MAYEHLRLTYSVALISRWLAVLAVLATFSACGKPEKVSFSDPRLKPLFKAVAEVDRASMGFTPVEPGADILLESGPNDGYDAMLHVEGQTSRTIAFQKTPNGYRWIGEQEIYTGPKTYTTDDGILDEQITVTHETVHISGGGHPLGKTVVEYDGPDARLANRSGLTLDDVKPILAEWQKAKNSKPK
jgi:hypothetical protein